MENLVFQKSDDWLFFSEQIMSTLNFVISRISYIYYETWPYNYLPRLSVCLKQLEIVNGWRKGKGNMVHGNRNWKSICIRYNFSLVTHPSNEQVDTQTKSWRKSKTLTSVIFLVGRFVVEVILNDSISEFSNLIGHSNSFIYARLST